jgi:hypothetical protein
MVLLSIQDPPLLILSHGPFSIVAAYFQAECALIYRCLRLEGCLPAEVFTATSTVRETKKGKKGSYVRIMIDLRHSISAVHTY